jgi:hypothetical protein
MKDFSCLETGMPIPLFTLKSRFVFYQRFSCVKTGMPILISLSCTGLVAHVLFSQIILKETEQKCNYAELTEETKDTFSEVTGKGKHHALQIIYWGNISIQMRDNFPSITWLFDIHDKRWNKTTVVELH